MCRSTPGDLILPYHNLGIKPRRGLWTAIFVVIAVGTCWPQAESGQLSGETEIQTSTRQAVPDPDAVLAVRDSGLAPSLAHEFPRDSRSSVLAGVQVSQGEATNPGGNISDSSQLSSVTSILGTLTLQKVRPRSETSVDYGGGGTFYGSYGNSGSYTAPHQSLDVAQEVLWKRGELSVTDSFQKVSGGNFGSSATGGAAASSLRLAANGASIARNSGASDFLGASQLSGLREVSYLANVSGISATEALTPRTSASFAAAYSIMDYSGSTDPLINSRQISMQGGYEYMLNRKDSLGVAYGYQTFRFQNGSGNITANSVTLTYRHSMSGRMGWTLGAGPEVADQSVGGNGGNDRQVNATLQASLSYHLEKCTLNLSYDRLVTAGSGLLAGGNSDIIRFSATRNILRFWQSTADAGYARVSSIAPRSSPIAGSSSRYFFLGAAVQRRLGSQFAAFASYQFNDENFNGSTCGVSRSCNGGANRWQIAVIGFNWHIHPIRLE